jgi:hypothetical protein
MLDDETNKLAHHKRYLENKTLHIFEEAVSEDAAQFMEARTQSTAVIKAMCDAIVPSDSRIGNILYFTSGQGQRKADTERGRKTRVCKE